MRAVLDTNVLVSAVLSPQDPPARVLKLWRQGRFDVVLSRSILAEYRRALSYPHIRHHYPVSDEDVEGLLEDLEKAGPVIETGGELRAVAADPDDDKVLECAVAGGADYIVSGDAHLLALEEYLGIRILPPAVFLAVLSMEQEEEGDDR
jgi:uncharacterized protein